MSKATCFRQAASAAPSSMACAAPCAMKGSMGWHAFPQQRDTPLRPFRKWIAIEQRPFERLIDRRENRRNLRMPPLIVLCGIGNRTAVGPLFPRPGRLFADRYKVQKSTGGNVVVDKVSAWPHPVRDIKWKAEMRDAFRGSEPPIRDLPREPRLFPRRPGAREPGSVFRRPR